MNIRLVGFAFCCSFLSLIANGEDLTDDAGHDHYHWLRDDTRQSLPVLAFLRRENAHTHSVLLPQQPLEAELLREWQGRIPTQSYKPWSLRGIYNYRAENSGHSYQLLRQDAKTYGVKPIIDLGQRAADSAYYRLGGWSNSPDHRYIALAEDRRGDRNYRLTVLDTQTGKVKLSGVTNAASDMVWGTDSRSLYWVENEPTTLRPFRVMCWSLDDGQQREVYREPSASWLVSVYPATSGESAFVQSNNHDSSEQRVLDLASGEIGNELRPRQQGIEYYGDIRDGSLYLKSNVSGEMALYRTALTNPQATWQRVWQPERGQYLKSWYLYPGSIVLEVAEQQLSQLVVLDDQFRVRYQRQITPTGGIAWLAGNNSQFGQSVRIRSMSMAQPPQWLELDLQDLSLTIIGGDSYDNLDPANYRSEQLVVKHQGVAVPVSLVYRPDRLTPQSPVVLYGYGAYGTPMRPYFMPQIMSLLDRGMIYAIAHVRGGGYLGPDWHQQGRGVNKPNTFADYIAVAQALKHYRNGRQRPLLAMGGSAGGTLVAAAINQQPSLFKAAVLQVPFVDVMATMSDPTLPLTLQEYGEWGDPRLPAERAVIAGYSPVDNIRSLPYPPMLVTAGLYDSQVPYWEPAKWVANVRDASTSAGPFLLSTNMEGGHRPDRRHAEQQQAREYAFLIWQATLAGIHNST